VPGRVFSFTEINTFTNKNYEIADIDIQRSFMTSGFENEIGKQSVFDDE
jgi:hypothetical protein